MRVDFLDFESRVYFWECGFEVLVEGVEDVPARVLADGAQVVEGLGFDLDGA